MEDHELVKRTALLTTLLVLVACGPRQFNYDEVFKDTRSVAPDTCESVRSVLWGIQRPGPGFRAQVRRCTPVGGPIQVTRGESSWISEFCDLSKSVVPTTGPMGPTMTCTYNGK